MRISEFLSSALFGVFPHEQAGRISKKGKIFPIRTGKNKGVV